MTREYKPGDRVRYRNMWWTVAYCDDSAGLVTLERCEYPGMELVYQTADYLLLRTANVVAAKDRARVDAGPMWGVP